MSLLGKEVLSNLSKLGVSSLTEFQSQAITRVLSNKNTVLLSPPGSGKTLSYLLSIASFCSQSKRPDSDDFSISSLFKDPIKTPIFPRPHGSLVIVPTHERLSEVYKKLRILAPWLSVKRASCTLASIVGTFGKTPDDFSNDHEYDEEGFKNIVRGCNWNKTDVVITTPANLHELAGFQRQLKIPHLNPALVVVDEIDWILEASDVSSNLKKAFDYIEDCSDKQFVLSGSVLPYAATSPDPLAILKKEFSNLQVVSSNDHNLIPSVKTNFISISDTPKMKLLESILESTRNKKVVIFCNHVSRCSDINDLCKSKNLNSYIICPHLHFEDRLWSHLQSLQQQESILVTNELGCRGFDMQADHVILYNLPLSLSSLVNKLGVLKKEGQGEVTFILEAEEEKIKEQFQPGEDWNKLFSFYSRQGAKKVNSFFST